MRVVHLAKIQGIGGAESHLLTLLPALRARGIDARFLSLDAGGDAPRFHRALEERDIPFERVSCRRDASPRLLFDVARALRRMRPDVVHTHMVHADLYGVTASLLSRTPVVSTRHNDDRYLLGPFRYVDRLFMRRVRRIVTISDAVQAFLVRAGFPRGKLLTIHYGLDDLPSAASELTPEQAGIPDGALLVLAIGRLIAQKDHATLLRAFARVAERFPDAHLAILGWGVLEDETRRLGDELGLANLHVLGRVEPRAWLTRADVFAHSSRWEGFGIVLLEAMLARLPIVATRVSAVPEIVVDGETGVLVPPGDAGQLGSELRRLLDDRALREAMGEAGRTRAVDRFSVARMADSTVELYRSVRG